MINYSITKKKTTQASVQRTTPPEKIRSVCRPLEGVGISVAKKDLGAPEARKKWCKCCDEFGEMVSQEVKTNPRYNKLHMKFEVPEPPR